MPGEFGKRLPSLSGAMGPSKNKAQTTLDQVATKGKKSKASQAEQPEDSQPAGSVHNSPGSRSTVAPSTPAADLAGEAMSKKDQMAMLNRITYQAQSGDETFQAALRLYKSLAHGNKSWFFLQYKRDKSCVGQHLHQQLFE